MADSSSVAVLMTCFNRRETTLDCVDRLLAQATDQFRIHLFLVDQGDDGTGQAVRARYPEAVVIESTDDLFWGGGTQLAYETLKETTVDHTDVLLLNDDTLLDPDSLAGLYQDRSSKWTVMAGRVRFPNSSAISYGGFIRPSKWDRLRFRPFSEPLGTPDTVNGNCLLVPKALMDAVEGLDPRFRHRFGDFDFGFRLVAAGAQLRLSSGVVGQCSTNLYNNPIAAAADYSLRDWIEHLGSIRGLPHPDWWIFAQTYGGPLATALWARTYVGAVARWAVGRARSRLT